MRPTKNEQIPQQGVWTTNRSKLWDPIKEEQLVLLIILDPSTQKTPAGYSVFFWSWLTKLAHVESTAGDY
jgi:hypothetical protein